MVPGFDFFLKKWGELFKLKRLSGNFKALQAIVSLAE